MERVTALFRRTRHSENCSRPDTTPEILRHFHPGKRFAAATFASYRAHPEFPSQLAAAQRFQAFVQDLGRPGKPWFRRTRPPARGLDLDGGFGVGKTHLLSRAYAVAAQHSPASHVHFQELTSVVGRLGMDQVVQVFTGLKLLCIDEFELDDPGNMHLIGTFLGRVMAGGVSVMTTSNTPPDGLGHGRFNAALFRGALGTIAARFEAIRIDGPDHRRREHPRQTLLTEVESRAWLRLYGGPGLLSVSSDELDDLILRVHPADFGRLLGSAHGVAVTGLRTFTHPNKMLREHGAVRFVHFVDKVYDLGLPVALTGIPIADLFEESYRTAAFGQKYSRCLSRVAELTAEAGQPEKRSGLGAH